MIKVVASTLMLLLLAWWNSSQAQQIASPMSIEITFSKTSSIVFACSIISVDRGSRDVLAQKAEGVQNVLQLKAARENFPETNLTVITADGMLHLFNVRFRREPAQLAFNLSSVKTSEESVAPSLSPVLFNTEMTEPEIEQYGRAISASTPYLHFLKDRSHKMKLALDGIYSVGNVMFFRVRIVNRSHINYDVDYLRFFVRDKKKSKRTSSQEILLTPLFIDGDDKHVIANSSHTIIYSIRKFTIPDAKKLYIEIMENAGGRHLKLSIRNKTIVGARPLPHQH